MAENPQVGVEVVGDWSKFDAEAAQRQNMKTTIGPTMGTEGGISASAIPGISAVNPWTTFLPSIPPPPNPWTTAVSPAGGPAGGAGGRESLGGASGGFRTALEEAAYALSQFARAIGSDPSAFRRMGGGGSGLIPWQGTRYSGVDETIDAEWVAVQRRQLGWQGQPTLPPGRQLPPPAWGTTLAGVGGGPAGGGPPGPNYQWGNTPGFGGGGGGGQWQGPMIEPLSRRIGRFMNRDIMSSRMMFNVMFGAHEIAQTTQAVQDMEQNAAYADTTEQSLQARIQGIHMATHGIFSGTASLLWDYSPWSASGPRETIRTLESAQFQMHTSQKTGDIMLQTRSMNMLATATGQGSEALKRAQIEVQALTKGREINTELARVSEQLSAGSIFEGGTLPWNIPLSTPDPRVGTFQYAIQGAERSGLLGKQRALRQQADANEATRKAAQEQVDREAAVQALSVEARRSFAPIGAAGTDRQQQIGLLIRQQAGELAQEQDPDKRRLLLRTHQAEVKGLSDRLDIESKEARHEIEANTQVQKARSAGYTPDTIANEARDAKNKVIREKMVRLHPELLPAFDMFVGEEKQADDVEQAGRRIMESVVTTSQGVQAAGAMRSQTRVTNLRIEGKSLQARYAQIDYERQQAFNMANSVTDQTVANNVRAAATEKAAADKTAAADSWQDEVRLLNMAASTTADVLLARKQRSPELAQAHETFGRARIDAVKFLDEHKGDPGARDIAVKGLENSKTMLDLQRRDYLESFRGQEINLTKLRVDNVRDQEDPTVVLTGIREDMARLENLIQHIAD